MRSHRICISQECSTVGYEKSIYFKNLIIFYNYKFELIGRNATAVIKETKFQNVTKSSPVMREVTVDPASVQVVQDLVDSEEILSNVVAENDLSNAVDVAIAEKPVVQKPMAAKPIAEKPIVSAAEDIVDNDIDKPLNENDPNPINKFCTCSSAQCKCCRDFAIPLIPVRGPGCATIRYLDNDKMSVQIKYGDFVLASRQIDSRKTTPICMPLPGGYNRFCGRVYGISRQDENFKACLGLELRADDEVEASLRVSCFQFGPRGLATMEAEPLPLIEEADSDEDDDDFLGLGARK